MLATPDFVLLNMPMTGATVVGEMLRAVYGDRAVEIGRTHAVAADVPDCERGKPLLSVFRSPFERYVSQYRYGCWRQTPDMYCDPVPILDVYPHYPDVSFGEFVRIADRYFTRPLDGAERDDQAPGWHTEQYLRFHARDAAAAYAALRGHAPSAERLKALEYPLHVLQAESGRLAEALAECMRRLGLPDDLAQRLAGFRPSSRRHLHEIALHRDAHTYYDRALAEFVLERERWLFARFPAAADRVMAACA